MLLSTARSSCHAGGPFSQTESLAVKATGTLLAARRWLDTPNPALNGQIPEEVARSPDGYAQVVQLLDSLMGAA